MDIGETIILSAIRTTYENLEWFFYEILFVVCFKY